MAAPVSTPSPVLREAVLARAISLREKAAAGELPYPDAILEANETFVARLEQSAPGSDLTALASAAAREARSADSRASFLATAAFGAAAAAAVFSVACPPLLGYGVAAASAALASRLVLTLSKQAAARADGKRAHASRLQAWAQAPRTDLKIPAWSGPLTVGGLRTLTRTFPEEVKEFPYAAELQAEHARLLGDLSEAPERPLTEVVASCVGAARGPKWRAASVVGLRLLSNACWIGGNAAIAVGQSWLGAGLMAGVVGTWGLRLVLESKTAADEARTARSLHYWDRTIQAAPATTPESIIFNGDRPKQPDRTIERSHEDVKIGGVKVPVRREDEP